jgi:hypothetical protein
VHGGLSTPHLSAVHDIVVYQHEKMLQLDPGLLLRTLIVDCAYYNCEAQQYF